MVRRFNKYVNCGRGEISFYVVELIRDSHIGTRLESRRRTFSSKKKEKLVSGEVQVQFTIVDHSDPSAAPIDILKRLAAVIGLDADDEGDEIDSSVLGSQELLDGVDDDDDDDNGLNTSDETDDVSKPDKAAKKTEEITLEASEKQDHLESLRICGRKRCHRDRIS